jgi:hypothetical protein
MTNKNEWVNEKVVLRNVTLNFPNLFKATSSPQYPTQKPAFSTQLIIPKGSDAEKAFEAAVVKVAKEQWGDKADKKLKEYRPNKMKFPARDGDDLDDKPWAVGKVLLTAKRSETAGRPAVVDQLKQPMLEDDQRIYSGAVVNASVVVAAQAGQNDGIRCQLVAVQYVKNGERLAGGPAATDADFEEIKIEEDEELI